MKKKVAFFAAILCQLASAEGAWAAGSSGSAVPTAVHAEGGRVFIHGNFANPDNCAINTPVVLTPANDRELDRMMSIALTALASGKKVSMWIIGCAPVNWAASASQGVSVSVER